MAGVDAMHRSLKERIKAHASLPLHRNAYALMFGSFSTALLGLVFWSLAAHRYSVHSVGIQSAMVAATQFLTAISALSLNNVLLRFLPIAGNATRRLILA